MLHIVLAKLFSSVLFCRYQGFAWMNFSLIGKVLDKKTFCVHAVSRYTIAHSVMGYNIYLPENVLTKLSDQLSNVTLCAYDYFLIPHDHYSYFTSVLSFYPARSTITSYCIWNYDSNIFPQWKSLLGLLNQFVFLSFQLWTTSRRCSVPRRLTYQ